ncbi:MAG: oligosaccharide flippase family protein [Acidobacteriota bacterium]|nr:oligosaccharide flippase family protein [Acidobacteriota bacterium]
MIRAILLLQFSQVLGRALYILFAMWYINRWLGVEAKGTWAALFALMTILGTFSNLGFEAWLTREVAGNAIGRKQALAFLFKAKSMLWVPCLLVGAWYVVENDYDLVLAFPFALALLFDGVGVAQQAVFEGKSRAGKIALMSFLKSGGFVLACVPVILWIEPTTLTPFTWLFAAVLLGRVIYGHQCWKLLPEKAPSITGRAWREFALMGSFTFVTVVYFKVDTLMLASMKGQLAAGYYDNAYNFVEGALFLSAAAGTMLYPRLVQSEPKARATLFDHMFLVVLTMGCAGSFGIWLLGNAVGDLLIGPENFEGSRRALTLLAAALPLMFANGLMSRYLFSCRMERLALITSGSVAIFNVVGNALVIPRHGEAGAALITVLTEGLLLVIWIWVGRRSPNMLLRVLGIAAITGAVAWVQLNTDMGMAAGLIGLVGFSLFFLYRLKKLRMVL